MTNELDLTDEICDNLLSMISSVDKSNSVVVEETIKNIDVERNLPYLLILYKECTVEARNAVFIDPIVEKINQVTNGEFDNNVTYSTMYGIIKQHSVSKSAMDYFTKKFAESLSKTLVHWGYSFIEDFDLILKQKK